MTQDRLLTLAREPNGLIITHKNSSATTKERANALLNLGKLRMAERFHDGSGFRLVAV